MGLIKCNVCGKDIYDNSKGCINCGAPVIVKNNNESWVKKNKKLLIIIIIVIVMIIFIKTFLFSIIIINDSSMYPRLKNNEVKILNKMDKTINRFDVVVVKYENNLIPRRIYGLPGETIEISNEGKVYVNGSIIDDNYSYMDDSEQGKNIIFAYTKIELNKNEYFVLGDNRKNSIDSSQKKYKNRSNPIPSMNIISIKDIKGTLLGVK